MKILISLDIPNMYYCVYSSHTKLMFKNISEAFTINGKTEYRSSSKIQPSRSLVGFGGAMLYFGEAFTVTFDLLARLYQSYYNIGLCNGSICY